MSQEPKLEQQTAVPGKQVAQSLRVGDLDVPYLLYLPDDYEQKIDTKWPLMLFLHGRGESNGPLGLVSKWGPPKFAKRGDKLPFILVAPQCPREGYWSDDTRLAGLAALLDHMDKSFRVDANKVMLTGLSMGGYGSWELAALHPKRFSCVVPICGVGDVADAEKLKSIPIWAFHGTDDKAVPFDGSAKIVEAIKAAGGTKVRFTSMEHVGHNSWTPAYAMPELYRWMLRQVREDNE